MKNISKELFEAIMGFKVVEFEPLEFKIKYYPLSSVRIRSIDWKPTLEEIKRESLFFMAIDWAWEKGYQIRLSARSAVFEGEAFCEVIEKQPKFYDDDEPVYVLVTNTGGENIFEALVEACQWIFNETKEK
jgi:hypothetical protein